MINQKKKLTAIYNEWVKKTQIVRFELQDWYSWNRKNQTSWRDRVSKLAHLINNRNIYWKNNVKRLRNCQYTNLITIIRKVQLRVIIEAVKY